MSLVAKTPNEAATSLDETIKADPVGYENLAVWAVFVNRQTGESSVCTNVKDAGMLRQMLVECAGHVVPSPIAVPVSGLILPHH